MMDMLSRETRSQAACGTGYVDASAMIRSRMKARVRDSQILYATSSSPNHPFVESDGSDASESLRPCRRVLPTTGVSGVNA